MTHFRRQVFRHTLSVHRRGSALFKGHAVKLGIAYGTARRTARVIDDDCVRLVLTDHGVKLVLFPISLLIPPVTVKPEAADLTVIRAKDLDGIAQILQIFREIVSAILVEPVDRRMIEKRLDVEFAAGIHKFAHEITSAGGMHNVIRIQTARIVERKSLVVARRHRNVFRACGFGNAHDLSCIKFFSRESVRKLHVFFFRDLFNVLNPFASAKLGIKSVMDKHTESHIFKI